MKSQATPASAPAATPSRVPAPAAAAAAAAGIGNAATIARMGSRTGAGAGQAQGSTAAKDELTRLATAAATQQMAARATDPTHVVTHPLLDRLGSLAGVSVGVLVTEALALVPSWNTPVLDAQGKPVQHVEGADRIGNHDILKRHEEVVGPKITALVNKLSPGMLHDLLAGFGQGATEAPGDSYRLEATLSDALFGGSGE